MNVIRLHTYLAKVLLAIMLWTGLAGPLAVVHARTLDVVPKAVAKLKHQAQHTAGQSEHGHSGGVAHSHNDVPVGDPDCLQFCAELLDTPGVMTVLAERPAVDLGKNLAATLNALCPSGIFVVTATSTLATGPPFVRGFSYQQNKGLHALLARNHRLRI